MRFFALTAVASLLSAVSAANITVIVGKNGTLTYTPNSYGPTVALSSFRYYGLIIGFASVTANVGDVVAFQLFVIYDLLTKTHSNFSTIV